MPAGHIQAIGTWQCLCMVSRAGAFPGQDLARALIAWRRAESRLSTDLE